MRQEQRERQDGPISGETGALTDRLTAAVRAADKTFQDVGGSSRHYLRECLLPELERAGLFVVTVPEGVKQDTPVTFAQAWEMMPPPYRAHMVAAVRYDPPPAGDAQQPFRRALEDVASRLAQVQYMPEMMRGTALAVLIREVRERLAAAPTAPPSEKAS